MLPRKDFKKCIYHSLRYKGFKDFRNTCYYAKAHFQRPVIKAVERDFYEWHQERVKKEPRKKRDSEDGDSLQKLMTVYLKEKFDINEDDPGILDIIQSTSSVGGGSAVDAETITKNIKKCSTEIKPSPVEEPKDEEHVQEYKDDIDNDIIDQTVDDDECVIMRNHKLLSSNYTVIGHIEDGQDCINHCYLSPNCRGYTWTSDQECNISHDTGKFVKQSGLQFTNFQICANICTITCVLTLNIVILT